MRAFSTGSTYSLYMLELSLFFCSYISSQVDTLITRTTTTRNAFSSVRITVRQRNSIEVVGGGEVQQMNYGEGEIINH